MLLSAHVLDLLLIYIKVHTISRANKFEYLMDQVYARNTKQHIVNVYKMYLEIRKTRVYEKKHVIKENIIYSRKLPTQHSEQCVIFHLCFKQFKPNSAYDYTNISVIKWHLQIM